ncbi:hypothetical protein Ade02nite_19280 [Paractinoplanes deccanensis]|uniref:Uncharacterized protein n=1 Tax=Paractinoplanes deccanensis TaxID=113561 RepID=A0ABQ3XZX7_9ACTN|nr:hypothetical protein [Actinoplanes deccanensis]GID73287.1 hypothetical protein Ade02nite_19280 [Actinoplanes deccanensis]
MTMTVTYPHPPEGLDARFLAVVCSVHCSHCGDAYEGEFGPVRFNADQLAKLSDFEISESGWIVNLDGLHSDEVGDHKLVCPRCAEIGWCDVCDEPIRAWQDVRNTTDVGVVHAGCTEAEASR